MNRIAAVAGRLQAAQSPGNLTMVGRANNRVVDPYAESLRYLYGLQKFGIKFGLSKTANLLKAFGDPHTRSAYVHIAGTNGKGSVAVFLASMLEQSGLRVGLYTSPHLVRFTERFRINGREIPRGRVVELVDTLKGAVVPAEPPTYFEATTAMALLYFSQEDTDLAILETGMGGRLDATNVVRPLLSVITNISLEHREYLGDTLREIALEKAGIIKREVEVVTGVRQPALIRLLQEQCRSKAAPLWRLGADFRCRTTPSGFHYRGMKLHLGRVNPGLAGRHQAANAALALAAMERLGRQGYPWEPEALRRGLEEARWPGRLQVISRSPLVVLDGAHNPAAARALALSVRQEFRYERLILVVGVMADKEIGELLKGIVPAADYVFYTRPVYPRAAAPEVLQAAAAPLGRPGEPVSRLDHALKAARAMAGPRDLVLVCGSLFTVGEALSFFRPRAYRPDSF